MCRIKGDGTLAISLIYGYRLQRGIVLTAGLSQVAREYDLLGVPMATGNSKQLRNQISHRPENSLKLFRKACSTIDYNTLKND